MTTFGQLDRIRSYRIPVPLLEAQCPPAGATHPNVILLCQIYLSCVSPVQKGLFENQDLLTTILDIRHLFPLNRSVTSHRPFNNLMLPYVQN